MSLNIGNVKVCSTCRVQKLLSDFGLDNSQIDRLNIRCKECVREKSRKRIDTDAYRKYQREYMRRRLHNDPAFKAAHNAITRRWREKNPERYRELHEEGNRRREMRIYGNDYEEGITLDAVFEHDNGTCKLCDTKCLREHASIDHVVAVSRGGGHIWDNVQLAHGRCNTAKGNRW